MASRSSDIRTPAQMQSCANTPTGIELGEIEHALRALPGVDEAVVLVHGDVLVAYVSPAEMVGAKAELEPDPEPELELKPKTEAEEPEPEPAAAKAKAEAAVVAGESNSRLGVAEVLGRPTAATFAAADTGGVVYVKSTIECASASEEVARETGPSPSPISRVVSQSVTTTLLAGSSWPTR